MRTRAHGKYTKMSRTSPRGIATCDFSGLMTRHADLVRQMEYSGSGLYWTGFMVHPKFSQAPQPQNLAPLIRLDPVPLEIPRPDSIVEAQQTLATSVGTLTLDVTGEESITLSTDQFSNGSFVFFGELTSDLIIIFPNMYNEFYVKNITTGLFTLKMQPQGNSNLLLEVPRTGNDFPNGLLFVNTCENFQRVYN